MTLYPAFVCHGSEQYEAWVVTWEVSANGRRADEGELHPSAKTYRGSNSKFCHFDCFHLPHCQFTIL